MKKFAFWALLMEVFLAPSLLQAQDINATELLGKWSVTNIRHDDAELTREGFKDLGKLKMIEDKFRTSVFDFKKGNHFRFQFPDKEMKIDDGYWSLSPDHKTVNIYEWKDRKSLLMRIFVSQISSLITFRLDETPFSCDVVKR